MDSGATSHMASDPDTISTPTPLSSLSHVTVGNGVSLPITYTGHTNLSLSDKTFLLNILLVVPDLVKNLLSVRQFTIDNLVSIEFDPFGFSIKDLHTGHVIKRCSSSGPLYTISAN
jgi:hypothetical protein